MTFATWSLVGDLCLALAWGSVAAGAARTLSSGNDETVSIAERDMPSAMR